MAYSESKTPFKSPEDMAQSNINEFTGCTDMDLYADLHRVEPRMSCVPFLSELIERIRFTKTERERRSRARDFYYSCLNAVQFDVGTLQTSVEEYQALQVCMNVMAKERITEQGAIETMCLEDYDVTLASTMQVEQPPEEPEWLAGYMTLITQRHEAELTNHSAQLVFEMDEVVSIDEIDNRIAQYRALHNFTDVDFINYRRDLQVFAERHYHIVETPGQVIALGYNPRVQVHRPVRGRRGLHYELYKALKPRFKKHIVSVKLISVLVNECRGHFGRMPSNEANEKTVSWYMRKCLHKHKLEKIYIDRHVTMALCVYFDRLDYDIIRNIIPSVSHSPVYQLWGGWRP